MAEGEENFAQSLSKLGIRAPRPFDPKKDKNFDHWVKRMNYHFNLAELKPKKKAAALLFQVDLDAFEIAERFGIKQDSPSERVQQTGRATVQARELVRRTPSV